MQLSTLKITAFGPWQVENRSVPVKNKFAEPNYASVFRNLTSVPCDCAFVFLVRKLVFVVRKLVLGLRTSEFKRDTSVFNERALDPVGNALDHERNKFEDDKHTSEIARIKFEDEQLTSEFAQIKFVPEENECVPERRKLVFVRNTSVPGENTSAIARIKPVPLEIKCAVSQNERAVVATNFEAIGKTSPAPGSNLATTATSKATRAPLERRL